MYSDKAISAKAFERTGGLSMQRAAQSPPVQAEQSHGQAIAAATGQGELEDERQSVSRRLSRAAAAVVAEVADTAHTVRDAVDLLLVHCLAFD
jgi:hypothetical protein